MTKDGFNKFLSALEAIGVKYWRAKVDDGINMYNSPSAVIAYDGDTLWGVRKRMSPADGFADYWLTEAAYVEDVHSVAVGIPKDKINEFFSALGVTLTDEQKDVIKNNGNNRDIIPETGDYVLAGFRVLSDEEIAKLSAQEKIDYEKKLAIYNQRQKATGPIISVQIG